MTSGILVASRASTSVSPRPSRPKGSWDDAARGRDPPHDRHVLRVTTTTLKGESQR
jgi:hypothetical protein